MVDMGRREALMRNHTGTHLLHSALRRVLGDHVRQQGSHVAPDRLRFDFSHQAQVGREELQAVADLANEDVITDDRVEVVEMSKADADASGAIAFFGDKYGDRVRVVHAGRHSTELCGGTHVGALGMIGPVVITSESSIGAGTRRIEALTGAGALALSAEHRRILEDAARMLKVEPEGLVPALDRLTERQRQADKEIAQLRSKSLQADAADLGASQVNGVVVARRDGLESNQMRELAQAVRQRPNVKVVVIGGSPDGAKVAIAAATDGTLDAGELVKQAAAVTGGAAVVAGNSPLQEGATPRVSTKPFRSLRLHSGWQVRTARVQMIEAAGLGEPRSPRTTSSRARPRGAADRCRHLRFCRCVGTPSLHDRANR